MAALPGTDPFPRSAAPPLKGSDSMAAWFSANWINIVLIAAIVLIAGLIVFRMIRNRKAGKHSCGGNCAACSACRGCCENPAMCGKAKTTR